MTEEASVKFVLDSYLKNWTNFELHNSLKNWTKFSSPKVVVAGFEWFVTGDYICCGAERPIRSKDGFYDYRLENTKFALQNAVVHCSPVQGKENSIWSCEAKGEIVAFGSRECSARKTSATMTQSKHWSHGFTFHNPKSVAMEFDFHEEFSVARMNYIYASEKRFYSKLELHVNVISHIKVDVSVPQNKMIESPEDAAKVVVDGTTLWLSKEVLGGACPFFHAYFNNDFKEKRDGVFPLTDVKLDEFLRFVAIIYGVHIDIDKTSLQYLLLLEDKYQCDAVRSNCHAFLMATDTLTNQEKLRIGDRFRFEDVVDAAIAKMDVHKLLAVGQQIHPETYSNNTTANILKAVSERVSLSRRSYPSERVFLSDLSYLPTRVYR